MRILFISQYFPPEMGAPAARVHELTRAWAARGHDVTVLTAFPHHPTGIIPEAYRGRRLMRETVDGVSVLRTWVYATPNKGFGKRTLSYISFMASATALGIPILSGRKFDVVIATSPQFFVAIAGLAASAAYACPFIFEVRDLWPESIKAVGALKDGFVLKSFERLEMLLYRRARLIVAVADSTVDILARRGVRREKIAVVKNGVDLALFRPLPRENSIRREYGLEGKFVCSYIGTIGLAHGLDIILGAATQTRANKDITYIIVGEGARKEELMASAAAHGLTNITFISQQSREKVVEWLAASDAVLVHLKKTELFEAVIPSKIFEIMGAGRPIIMGVRGEAAKIVENAGAGIQIEPENAAEFVAAIERLRRNTKSAEKMGRSGRAFVEAHFDRNKLADDYLKLLSSVAH